ncbi:MAG TPA: hypothetical protein VIY48_12140 [Candidatus Paceibacterota bacterium]
MGQTDTTYRFYDADGRLWEWLYTCPHCDDILATQRLVEMMGLDGDDIIGCDGCTRDVSVDGACLVLFDEDGNRA